MSIYRFRLVLLSFLQHPGLPFAQALPEASIQQAFDDGGVSFGQGDDDVYTPALTLWAFLSQALFAGEQRSCTAAVARVVVLLVALGRDPCSDNTGAYCRARAKLPVAILRRLTEQLADECAAQVPQHWLWKGRHVHLVDGTTVSMPDTPSNQQDYPQPSTQKPEVGFPIARMVVLLSLATGMLTAMELGPYQGKETGETALFRQVLDRLPPGAIVLADRHYCSYFMIALLAERGIDFVGRLHQCRTANYRRGLRLGSGDHIVYWPRPDQPDWMDDETYARMPGALRIREVHVQVQEPGFRVESLDVVTTLTDADTYCRDDLAELYHQRWLVELDIRALKVNLGMDVLRCKTAERVRREIWTGLLAYNSIRKTMLQAALLAKRSPRQLSFTTAMQKIAASWGTLAAGSAATALRLIDVHLEDLATHRVGHRPDRVEPRAIKRRPKKQKLLMQPRRQAREALRAGVRE